MLLKNKSSLKVIVIVAVVCLFVIPFGWIIKTGTSDNEWNEVSGQEAAPAPSLQEDLDEVSEKEPTVAPKKGQMKKQEQKKTTTSDSGKRSNKNKKAVSKSSLSEEAFVKKLLELEKERGATINSMADLIKSKNAIRKIENLVNDNKRQIVNIDNVDYKVSKHESLGVKLTIKIPLRVYGKLKTSCTKVSNVYWNYSDLCGEYSERNYVIFKNGIIRAHFSRDGSIQYVAETRETEITLFIDLPEGQDEKIKKVDVKLKSLEFRRPNTMGLFHVQTLMKCKLDCPTMLQNGNGYHIQRRINTNDPPEKILMAGLNAISIKDDHGKDIYTVVFDEAYPVEMKEDTQKVLEDSDAFYKDPVEIGKKTEDKSLPDVDIATLKTKLEALDNSNDIYVDKEKQIKEILQNLQKKSKASYPVHLYCSRNDRPIISIDLGLRIPFGTKLSQQNNVGINSFDIFRTRNYPLFFLTKDNQLREYNGSNAEEVWELEGFLYCPEDYDDTMGFQVNLSEKVLQDINEHPDDYMADVIYSNLSYTKPLFYGYYRADLIETLNYNWSLLNQITLKDTKQIAPPYFITETIIDKDNSLPKILQGNIDSIVIYNKKDGKIVAKACFELK